MFTAVLEFEEDPSAAFWRAFIIGLLCVLLLIVPAVVIFWSFYRRKGAPREDTRP